MVSVFSLLDSHLAIAICSALQWFSHLQTGRTLTVRDLLSWIAFITVTERSLGATYAFLHGVFLILLDGLSLGTSMLCYPFMFVLVICCIYLQNREDRLFLNQYQLTIQF